jgi:hypothetical protein
MNSRSITLQFY